MKRTSLRHTLVDLRLLAALVALIAVVAGPSCKAKKEGRPSVDVTNENICSEIAEVACYNMLSCCTRNELENVFGLSSTQSTEGCRRDLKLLCEGSLAEELWALDEGTVSLDRPLITGCLTNLLAPAGVCRDVVSDVPWQQACDGEIWTGLVPAGGECFYGFECAPGSICTTDRRCTALPVAQEDCSRLPCAEGLYCDQSSGVCESRKAVGIDCNSSQECEVDLYCDFAATPNPICTARLALGAACLGNNQCESRTCVPGLCEGSGNTCFQDSDCSGACENDGSFCFDSQDCSGTCDASPFDFCQANFQCPTNLCNNSPCLQSCIGSPVCGSNQFTINYCSDPLNVIMP